MRGLVGRPDGTQLIADKIAGDSKRAEELGISFANTLLGRGAGAILAECN